MIKLHIMLRSNYLLELRISRSKLLLIVLALFLPAAMQWNTASAQAAKLRQLIPIKAKNNIIGYTYVTDNSYMILWGAKFKSDKFYLTKYNMSGGEEEFQRELDLQGPKGSNTNLVAYLQWQDRLCLLLTKTDKESKALLIVKVTNRGTLDGEPVELAKWNRDELDKDPKFRHTLSQDKKKIAIYVERKGGRKEVMSYDYLLINNDLNVVFRKTITFQDETSPDDISLRQVAIDSTGQLYQFVGLIKYPEERRRKGKLEFYIMKLSAKGPENAPDALYRINLDNDAELLSGGVIINYLNELVFCGSFISGRDQTGVLYATIDGSTGKFIISEQQLFTNQQLRAMLPSDRRQYNLAYTDFYINNLAVQPDNSILITGQTYSSYTTTNYNGRTTTFVYHYLYNQMMVWKFNPAGRLEKLVMVPKFQHTTNDLGAYSGYTALFDSGVVYLIYPDNAKNAEVYKQEDLKQMSTRRALMVAAVNIEQETYQKAILYDFSKAKAFPSPALSYIISPNTAIIPSARGFRITTNIVTVGSAVSP